jgi:nitronate monooxygenase
VLKSRFYYHFFGSPEETIKAAHKVGLKFFVMLPTCLLPKKVESLGADA